MEVDTYTIHRLNTQRTRRQDAISVLALQYTQREESTQTRFRELLPTALRHSNHPTLGYHTWRNPYNALGCDRDSHSRRTSVSATIVPAATISVPAAIGLEPVLTAALDLTRGFIYTPRLR